MPHDASAARRCAAARVDDPPHLILFRSIENGAATAATATRTTSLQTSQARHS
jgi:hypothetical protein